MYGADPKHFVPRRRRAARAGSSPRRACRIRSASRTCTRPTTWPAPSSRCAGASRRSRKVVVKLNEGVSGEGNAHLDLDGLAATGLTRRARGRSTACRRCASSRARCRLTRYFAKLAERGGIVEERIVGQRLPQPERAAARDAARRGRGALHARPGARAGRADRAIWAAASRPTSEYGPAIMREALKVGRRLMREGVLGRFALDFVTVRNAQRPVGGLRHRDQPAEGRHDAPVPDAAVPDRRRLQRGDRRLPDAAGRAQVLRRQRPRRVAAVPRLHARTTCSTSSRATACTSTRRATRASSST